jgi:3-hydroxyisobutyrate dehydrogenase-like beta-hydroxyacid dehydrogenase
MLFNITKRLLFTNSQTRIGFIGLGQMGFPMASNLFKKMPDTTFWVHDNTNSTAMDFQAEHRKAKIAASPKEIAENCEVIITMLPASKHVRSVYLGESGLLASLKPGSLVIDSSTIDVSTTKEICATLKEAGVSLLDAPVSGGSML